MIHKDTAFYKVSKLLSFYFSAEKISSSGFVWLLEKLKHKHK